MAKIGQLIEFNKEAFFDGAIQADWFYNIDKRNSVAESYIFHGPKYFGLNENDISISKHKLIDTISFVNKIAEKIAYDSESSRFVLSIAGYGAGKSHLSVTMGSLFSGDNRELQGTIISKIENIDKSLAGSIKGALIKPNLVIVLNGMKDFNLNYEILKNLRLALKLHNVSDDFLKEMTQAYNIAKVFIENTFSVFENLYIKYSTTYKKYSMYKGEILKKSLIENLENDMDAFNIINEVYNSINGSYIRWDNGLTAGDILEKASEVLCDRLGIFNKIVLLFDEFGRYIEYTASHPQQAGESALQQIFEAVQNANKNIIFIGFIQSDLNAYLNRVQNANVRRYVGRFDGSDKYYLSSNMETVLANLLKKKDEKRFEDIINNLVIEKNRNYNNTLFNNIGRWIKESTTRGVWSDKNLYDNVILKGVYPIHPITVWIMSNLSKWMQQRSTLTFIGDIFNRISENEIMDEKLFYVYPTDIIESKLFNELLSAEEKGIQQSQNCILYNNILIKYEGKIEGNRLKVLQGILISNIGKFTPYDKEDMIALLKYCTGIEEDNIKKEIKELEENFGVVRFDDTIKRFELLAEGNGKNEFNRKLVNNKIRVAKGDFLAYIDEQLRQDLALARDEETTFAINNHISSIEWKFSKRFVHSKNIDESYINSALELLRSAPQLDANRGLILFVYLDNESLNEIDRINNIIREKDLKSKDIIFILIEDNESKIRDGLIEYKALNEFNGEDSQTYSKFIHANKRIAINQVVRTFYDLAQLKRVLNGKDVSIIDKRLTAYCNDVFTNNHTKAISFIFDGFEKKLGGNIRNYYSTICRGLITNSITNKKSLEGLDPQISNRLKSSLSVERSDSWKVLSKTGALIKPQAGILKEIYEEIDASLKLNEIKSIGILFNKYLYSPYSMNEYSLGLLISYYIALNSSNLNIYNKESKLKKVDFANKVFSDKKIDFDMLKKYTIQRTEGTKEDELKRTIDKISNTIYVENCADALIEIKALENEELNTEYLATLELLKEKVFRGLEKKKKIYDQLNSYKEYIEKYFISKFNIHALAKIYKPLFMSNFNGKIDDSEFEYSKEYIDEIIKLRNLILESIENKLPLYLKESYKFGYVDLKEEGKNVSLICQALNKMGLEKEGVLLEDTYKSKKQQIIENQKYIAIFNEFDSFINSNSLVNTKNYKELEQLKEIIINWNERIQNLDISSIKRKKMIEQSIQLQEKINFRRESLDKSKIKILNSLNNINSVDELRQIESSINNYLMYLPVQEDEIELKNILDKINSVLSELKQLELSRDNRAKFESIAKEFKDRTNNEFTERLLDKAIEEGINHMDIADAKWVENNISYIKENIAQLSIEECETWRVKTRDIPLYLKDESIELLKNINLMINDKIKNSKVDGIISIFKELDEDEKERCLRLLHQYLQ